MNRTHSLPALSIAAGLLIASFAMFVFMLMGSKNMSFSPRMTQKFFVKKLSHQRDSSNSLRRNRKPGAAKARMARILVAAPDSGGQISL